MNIKLATTLFTIVATGAAGLVLADLKSSAPKNVNLSAIWKINTEQSDDPHQAVAKKRTEAAGPGRSSRGRGGGIQVGNASIDMGDVFGGGVFGGGTVSTGKTGNEDRPDGDPAQSEGMRMPLDNFLATREQFEIQQQPDSITIATLEETSSCKPGQTSQVPTGNGETFDQRCGWDGDTFVVELKSPDGVTRTNRYELRRKDQQLVMVSTVKGGKGTLSGLQIRRVYDRIGAF